MYLEGEDSITSIPRSWLAKPAGTRKGSIACIRERCLASAYFLQGIAISLSIPSEIAESLT